MRRQWRNCTALGLIQGRRPTPRTPFQIPLPIFARKIFSCNLIVSGLMFVLPLPPGAARPWPEAWISRREAVWHCSAEFIGSVIRTHISSFSRPPFPPSCLKCQSETTTSMQLHDPITLALKCMFLPCTSRYRTTGAPTGSSDKF